MAAYLSPDEAKTGLTAAFNPTNAAQTKAIADAAALVPNRYTDTPGTTPPGPTPPTATSSASTPVTRYTDVANAAFAQGGAFGDQKPYTPEEEAAVREKARKEVQAQIDAANEVGNQELAAAQQRGTERLGRSRAGTAATGTIGSPTGDTILSKTEDVNSQEQKAIRAATAEKVSNILAGVATRADSLIQQRKADAGKNAESYINYLKTQSDQSVKDMTALATAQHDLSSTERQHLLDQTGYDPATFDALYDSIKVANTPKADVVGTPVTSGSKIIYTIKDPKSANGLKQIILDAGVNLEKGKYSISSDSNGVYVLDQEKGTYKKIGEPTGAGSSPEGYNGDFEATIKLAAQAGGSVFQQKQIAEDMKAFIASGDFKSAYAQVLDSTAKKLGGADATKFNTQNISLGALDEMEKALKAYSAAGGDTNIFKGSLDKIQTKIGALVTDPKYAALATELNTAFQNYRLNMTGAAFGPAESAEYASVIPSSSNTLDLNLAKISGARSYLNSQINNGIVRGVGQGGVEIRHYAEGAVKGANGAPAGATTRLIGPDNIPYNVPNDQVEAFKAAGGHE